MLRSDGRASNKIRDLKITTGFVEHAAGSVLIELGKTKILCSVSINKGVPSFLRGKGRGWLTAEYAMLPASTHNRMQRESMSHNRKGRTVEISRLIGRVFRAVSDLKSLGEKTVTIDCDVLQADGGTRTAAITGACLALKIAEQKLMQSGEIDSSVLRTDIAAISAGIVDGELFLDLAYDEDSRAELDFNFILTKSGDLLEVQGTAEENPISWDTFEQLKDLSLDGVKQIFSQLD